MYNITFRFHKINLSNSYTITNKRQYFFRIKERTLHININMSKINRTFMGTNFKINMMLFDNILENNLINKHFK